MEIFVAGATGAVGRRLVPLLLQAGHRVTGLTRSESRAAALRAMGATAAVADVLDGPAVEAAVAAAAPDAIISQLTDLPAALKPRGMAKAYAGNNRVRTVGNYHLLAAARRTGVPRIVAQSVAFWYRPDGDVAATESESLDTDAAEPIGSAVRAMKSVEDQLLAEPGLDAVILRYGFFYGPGTWHCADGDVGRQMRRRAQPIIGSGRSVYSLIEIDDAARAAVAALTGPLGVFNIVDDEPAAANDWMPAFAAAIGAPKPMHVPAWIPRLVVGRAVVSWLSTLRGADNSAAKEQLQWQPAYPSWREGFPATLNLQRH